MTEDSLKILHRYKDFSKLVTVDETGWRNINSVKTSPRPHVAGNSQNPTQAPITSASANLKKNSRRNFSQTNTSGFFKNAQPQQ
jgi:hypothetical protein